MRLVPSLASLILAIPAALPAASLIERQEPHAVELHQLVEQPQAYQGMRVKFKATFVQTAGLFDPYHTHFTSERSLNVVVWDDEAHLWEPQVRAAPVVTLYYDKDRDGAQLVSSMRKYTRVEVIGEVVSDFRRQPWINCHTILPIENAGAFTDNAVWHLEQAGVLHHEAGYVLADEHFTAALDESLPDYAKVAVHELQGRNRLAAKDPAGAAAIVSEAIALLIKHPSIDRSSMPVLRYLHARALSEIAERRVAEGQNAQEIYAEAVAEARESVRLDPDVGDAYAVLGICLAGLEQWEDAKRQCARAIRMLPDNAEIRWYLGRIQDRQGDHAEAIATLKKGIDLAPKDYRLHKAIAAAYFNRHKAGGPEALSDLVTALREDDIAIRLNAADPDLHYHSGLVIERGVEVGAELRIGAATVKASIDQAVKRWQDCVAVDATYHQAHLALARRFRKDQRHDESVGHFQKALALVPEREELYAELGGYLWELGKKEDAYQVFASYQKRNPGHLDTIYALGRLSLEVKQWQRGAQWLELLIKSDPKRAAAHADLTEMKYELSDDKSAVLHADLALGLLGEDAAAKARVSRFKGLALFRQDQTDAARSAFDGQIAGTADVRVLLAAGWSLTAGKDAKEQAPAAIALGQEAIKLDSASAGAKELVGWAQYLGGDPAAAEKTLAEAAIADPNLAAYRRGMAIYAQGSARYVEAKPLLEQAAGKLRSDRKMLREAPGEARTALNAIRVWERDEAKKKASEAAAAKKAADEAARKKAIDDAAAAKKKAADDVAAKKAADEAARKKAIDDAAAAKKKAADDAAVKKAAEEAARKKALEDAKKPATSTAPR